MIDLAASFIGSTISTTLLYPAERIKIYLQLDKGEEEIVKSISKINQEQGIAGFYRGVTSLIIGNGISYGVYFVVYQRTKAYVIIDSQILKSLLCSGIAGVFSSIVTNPFWVLQTREAHQNKSMIKSAGHLIKQQGILSLWKGLFSSIILVLNPMIQFVVYQFLKIRLNRIMKNSDRSYDFMIFLIGAISKIISTLITYPYTTIRTKQHVNKKEHISLKRVLEQIINQGGYKGLYRGLKPKLIQTVLNSAIMLMIYEKIRRLLINYFARK